MNPNITFAFQPIYDIQTRRIFAYEALVRGRRGESAGQILSAIPPEDLHAFDRDIRAVAISLAAARGLSCKLSLNLLPQALTSLPDAISNSIDAAMKHGIALENIILEVTEGEIIGDPTGLAERMNEWRGRGVSVAIDDFGAGYSGLNLLAEFQPDIVKLDMNLVRSIDSKGPRQAIVRGVLRTCRDLGLEVIAEGVETESEFHWFRRQGVVLYQGYLIARPAFEALAEVDEANISALARAT